MSRLPVVFKGMESRLVIVIDYTIRPRAEDIGALLSALAKDYKTISKGRVLVVASIDHGSIIATLVDWAFQAIPYVKGTIEVAKGAKALADFAKVLKDGINAAKPPNSTKLPQASGGKRSVHRSVRALVKTAAENGCDIRVKHTGADGEILEVEMTAPQAVEAQVILEVPKAIPVDTMARGVVVPRLPILSEAIGRLHGPEAAAYSVTEVQGLVDSLFEILQALRLTHLIPQLAADLSQKGLFALAAALQAKMHSRDGTNEPPFTTT